MNDLLLAFLQVAGLVALLAILFAFVFEGTFRILENKHEAEYQELLEHRKRPMVAQPQSPRIDLRGKLLDYWYKRVLRGTIQPTVALQKVEEINQMWKGENHEESG